MIVVDSSVWINAFRGVERPSTTILKAEVVRNTIIVGDLVMLDVLQGSRDDLQARRLENRLREFRVVSMLDDRLAVKVAENFRRLRSAGRTIRKTIDLIIATYCVENDLPLLHDDRDFRFAAEHLDLKLFPV